MQHGYSTTTPLTIELILFGALFEALYYVYRCPALEGRVGWCTPELFGAVDRVDLNPGY
jgi:hypothetical protein